MLKKISCDQQLFQIVVVFYFAVGLFFAYLVSLMLIPFLLKYSFLGTQLECR